MSILGIRPLTRSLHDLRERGLRNVIDKKTDRNCGSMTELAQWANSVKILYLKKYSYFDIIAF